MSHLLDFRGRPLPDGTTAGKDRKPQLGWQELLTPPVAGQDLAKTFLALLPDGTSQLHVSVWKAGDGWHVNVRVLLTLLNPLPPGGPLPGNRQPTVEELMEVVTWLTPPGVVFGLMLIPPAMRPNAVALAQVGFLAASPAKEKDA